MLLFFLEHLSTATCGLRIDDRTYQSNYSTPVIAHLPTPLFVADSLWTIPTSLTGTEASDNFTSFLH